MHATYANGVTIRPLRNGDAATVLALFDRLGERARASRFCGAKPRLTDSELAILATVDANRHVLVGYVDGDAGPAGIARLVRDGARAEIALSVADDHRGRGVGTSLLAALAADARAAGITSFVATVCGDNPPMLGILRKLSTSLEVRWHRGEREIVVPLVVGSGLARSTA
jgi:GNAT superfamily N-acetyltransferase